MRLISLLLSPQPIFRVMGFSVTGRVLNSPDGEGVPDATVTLNNQIKGELPNPLFCMYASMSLRSEPGIVQVILF